MPSNKIDEALSIFYSNTLFNSLIFYNDVSLSLTVIYKAAISSKK